MSHIFERSKTGLNNFEQKLLFRFFDHDNGGTIDGQEFQRAVCGRMPRDCLDFVRKKFSELDRDNDGHLSKDELTFFFSCQDHPSVKAGMKTGNQVLQEMLTGFHCETDAARVNFTEWSGFHLEMYSVCDGPEDFKRRVELLWRSCEKQIPALVHRIKYSLNQHNGGALGASRAFYAVANKETKTNLNKESFSMLLDKLTSGTFLPCSLSPFPFPPSLSTEPLSFPRHKCRSLRSPGKVRVI
jgi:hypothetical protein